MEISNEKIKGLQVVKIGGRIDSSTAVEFEKKMIEIIDSGNNTLVVDFTKIVFISSAGLRVLLLAAKKVKPYGGKIILCGLSKEVREVFDISGFTAMFAIYGNLDETFAAQG